MDNCLKDLVIMALVLLILLLPGSVRAADFSAWCTIQTEKILPEATPRPMPASGFRLFSGRNEWVVFQVAVKAGAADLDSVQVEVGDFQGPEGRVFPGKSFTRYIEHYTPIPAYHESYPDPLLPYEPFSVAAGAVQPVWLEAFVPADTPPGNYRGEVIITAGGTTRTIPLRWHVFGVTFPDTPRSRSAFGLGYSRMHKLEGVETGTPEAHKLDVEYYETMVAHRLSPYSPPYPPGTEEALPFLKDKRVTAFLIPYTSNEEKLAARVEALRKQGLLEKGYFYLRDEPYKPDHYKQLYERWDKLVKVFPEARNVCPYDRVKFDWTEKSVYQMLDGYVNIWCPKLAFFEAEPLEKFRKRGDEIWWYVCCCPTRPYPNLFVYMTAAEHRVLGWMQAVNKVQGLLYWESVYWNYHNPWEDINTLPPAPNTYGEACLFYPGKPVGIDGPVVTLRLKLLRAAMYDFDLLSELADRKGLDFVKTLAAPVVIDLSHFTWNGAVIERARRNALEALEVAEQKTPTK